jgi:DNA polymerase III subunit beta
MNFVVSASSLQKHLKLISGILNTNNTIPILDSFLFELKGNELKMSASDMETSVSITMNVESSSNGNVAIPAKTLLETLANLPEQPVSIIIDNSRHGVKIKTETGDFHISGQNGEEYPRMSRLEAKASLVIKTDILESAISKTLFATGNDDLRPVMNGVYCQFFEDHSIFVATDAHKLVRYTRQDARAGASASFIMPKKPLNVLRNLLGGIDDAVKIEFNQTNAYFSFGNVNLTCRLIDGKYPNYEAVIPKNNPNKLHVDRSAFLGALKRVGVFASRATHQIRLAISGSQLRMSAEDIDFANEGHEVLTCTYTGEDMEIGFNSRFLVEMVSNLDCDEIIIEMSAPNRAGIIIPNNTKNPSEDLLMLVMPVMLNN